MTRLSAWKTVGAPLMLWAATAIAGQAQTFFSLVSFNGANGEQPYIMSLVQGLDGNFYGTTTYGGAQSSGTVFRVAPDGTLTKLYSFCDHPSCSDGAYPSGGLVLATNGAFYGTTSDGGRDSNSGTVFKMTSGGKLTSLHTFTGGDGTTPNAAVTQGTDGNLYGTTNAGGTYGYGSVFKITTAGVLTTMHSFDRSDGAYTSAKLVQGSDGNFYGTNLEGGRTDSGTVFRITPSGKLTTIHVFCSQDGCPDGGAPYAGLVQGNDGGFYGTTSIGGIHAVGGTVFRITPAGALTTLYSFCAQPNCTDGDTSTAGLLQATDGNFYGATTAGGDNGQGTAFKITPTGTLTTLHSFCQQGYPDCTDGAGPYGGLLQRTSGLFNGTTRYGGTSNSCSNGCGTVFSLDTGLGPFVTFVRNSGRVGQTGPILGQGLTGTTSVLLNGTPASFTVVSDTYIRATVPEGATTGYVTVTTPSGTLTSNVPFHVLR